MTHSATVCGRAQLGTLALAALGIVYGDIGTSPLYALREVFASPHHPVPVTPENVLGILSLVFWALMLVISGKYVSFIMRADNRGEGGIMALMALALRDVPPGRQRRLIVVLGLFGAALFYGDGVITPTISVLSAVEGLEIITPAFTPFVIPVSLFILVLLFCLQRRGTASVGKLFGPIMLVWFAVLAVLGLNSIRLEPGVLRAVDPSHALAFFGIHPVLGFFSLGAVVLAITGGEALYADMGHFGRRPIRVAWFCLVLPALLLNYFGQGALLLSDPSSIENPFYRLAPNWALYPMVALSTAATVIASQAVISGAFSLTLQAMQLGYLPRFEVHHTSEQQIGQIYLPAINWLLLAAVVAAVLGFGSSSHIAAAYGIAVTGTMLITNLLAYVVARREWRWRPLPALSCTVPFVLIDLAFFSSNSTKIVDGGWFPLAFALFVFTLLMTWKRGRELLHEKLDQDSILMAPFVDSLRLGGMTRVPGTAVFLTGRPAAVPRALLHSLKHYKVLHERMVLVSVRIGDTPYVPIEERVDVRPIGENFWQVTVSYGFKDETDLPAALACCASCGLDFDMMDTSFFLGREALVPRLGEAARGMARWRVLLFTLMFRNAGSITAFLRIPSNRVVELGAQIVL